LPQNLSSMETNNKINELTTRIQNAGGAVLIAGNKSNEFGTESITQILAATIEVAAEVNEALEDGKIGYLDAVKIGLELREQMPQVLRNWKRAAKEFTNLNYQEVVKIVDDLRPLIDKHLGGSAVKVGLLIDGLLWVFGGFNKLSEAFQLESD